METTNRSPWIDLVCAGGSTHAARPTLDQRTSECRHPDSSLDGETQGNNAPIRRGDTQNRAPPEKSTKPWLPTQLREQSKDWCPLRRTPMRRLSGQRASQPRVKQVRRNGYKWRVKGGTAPPSKGAREVEKIGGGRLGIVTFD